MKIFFFLSTCLVEKNFFSVLIICWSHHQALCTVQAWHCCRWPQSCSCSGWLLEAACLLPASGAAWHPAPASWSPQVVIRTSLPHSLPWTLTLCLSLHCHTRCESQNYPQPDSFLQLDWGSQTRQSFFLLSFCAVSPCTDLIPLVPMHSHRVVSSISKDSKWCFLWTRHRPMKRSHHNLFTSNTLHLALASLWENISYPCPGKTSAVQATLYNLPPVMKTHCTRFWHLFADLPPLCSHEDLVSPGEQGGEELPPEPPKAAQKIALVPHEAEDRRRGRSGLRAARQTSRGTRGHGVSLQQRGQVGH